MEIIPYDRHYWKAVEEDIRKFPATAANYRLGFLVEKSRQRLGDALSMPIQLIDGRLSFGKLQFKIVPYGVKEGLGSKWVDRKFLVLHHDSNYGPLATAYKSYDPPDREVE